MAAGPSRTKSARRIATATSASKSYEPDLVSLAPEHPRALMSALNLANSLCVTAQFTDAAALVNETLPTARRVCGDAHDITLGLRFLLTRSIVLNPDTTQEDLRGAKEEAESLLRTTRRVFGTSHPRVELVRTLLKNANDRLSLR